MRKLATIRQIAELVPIEGADLIQLAKIDGWQCVVKKSEFNVGDLCVYFEIDSHLPIRPEFEILRRNSLKRMGDREGFRIKTAKLRGALSQGLALPVNLFFNDFVGSKEDEGQELSEFFFVGNDISELLDVQKYEAAIPTEIAGKVRGNFPQFIPKTDQERCQNLGSDIFVKNADSRYEVTMKMDGTSFTAYRKDDHLGVCGRNWELKVDEDNASNTLVRMFVDSGLHAALAELGSNYAVQGELMGPAIQGNREGFTTPRLFIFDIYDIDAGQYLTPENRHRVLTELWNRGLVRDIAQHVPVLSMSVTMAELGIGNVKELLAFAEGPSFVHPVREGLVFKRVDGGFSFKSISNAFLLKEKD